MAYEIEIDKEIEVGGKSYSIYIEADLTYSNAEDPEPTAVEIAHCDIADEGGNPVAWDLEEGTIEKVKVYWPDLEQAIDGLLWSEIQTHTEDNYRDIQRDLEDDSE